ncbi:MAG: 7TM diverse intracellular signaling domain-containing protein [Flavobacteriales bacterium]
MKAKIFLLLLFLSSIISAQENISTLIYIDSSATESFEKVSDSSFQKNFKPVELPYSTGNNAFNFWLKVRVTNPGKESIHTRLVLNSAIYHDVRCYYGKIYSKNRNVGTRNKHMHTPNIPMELVPGDNEILIEVVGIGGAYGIDFNFLEEETFQDEYTKKTFGLSFFYGLVFMILLLNIFYWITLKKRAFLSYSIYVLLTINFYSVSDGMAYLNIFGDIGEYNRYSLFSNILIYFGFLPTMALDFMQLRGKQKWIDNVANFYLIWVPLSIVVACIWDSNQAYSLYFSYHNITIFSPIIFVFIIIYKSFKEKSPLAKSFLLAFSILAAAFIICLFESYGGSDLGIGWQIIKIGSAIEIIILSFALASNFRSTELSYKKVQQDYSNLEYSFLRTQMNPHFLFNILGSIQNRIQKDDKEGALELVRNFSGMVRQVVDSSEEEFIPLKQEITFLKNYSSLQGKNYGDRFSLVINIDPAIDIENYSIPNMVLQPFVENAFVHAFPSVTDRKLTLEITFKKENNNLICFIKDNGQGLIQRSEQLDKKSIGIKNTRERLEKLSKKFNQDFSITITNRKNEQGTVAELHLPFEID